jgi:hypothetical protein
MIRNAIVSLLLVSLILPGASSAAQSAEAARLFDTYLLL